MSRKLQSVEPELVQHIVDGLLANGTPDAWSTLHGLLTDQVTSALPGSEATEIVIISLIREMETKPEPVEKVLLSILDGSTPLPPANRSAALKTLAAVSAAASNQLTKLGPTTVALPSGGGASAPASGGLASAASVADWVVEWEPACHPEWAWGWDREWILVLVAAVECSVALQAWPAQVLVLQDLVQEWILAPVAAVE